MAIESGTVPCVSVSEQLLCHDLDIHGFQLRRRHKLAGIKDRLGPLTSYFPSHHLLKSLRTTIASTLR